MDEAHRLKQKYANQISLLVGLETEYITPLDLDRLQVILDDPRIEYMVGSVHHVHDIPIDFDQETYIRAVNDDLGRYLVSYLDAQFTLLERFKPEIVGHMDLCRLYTPDLNLSGHPDAWSRLERNVQFAISYGALFEVNAAAFRKGWDSAYPAPDVFELIQKHGGRFALSDDSHGPHAVGLNYDKLHRYLERMGLEKIWKLEQMGQGRETRATEVAQWQQHKFWLQ